jgi:hypothetical protein
MAIIYTGSPGRSSGRLEDRHHVEPAATETSIATRTERVTAGAPVAIVTR